MAATYTKDPDAVLDYKWDWAALTNQSTGTNWLAAGETIVTATVTVPTGITLDSSARSDNNTSVVAWLSGGTDGEIYVVNCRIVTTAGRTDDRSIWIKVATR